MIRTLGLTSPEEPMPGMFQICAAIPLLFLAEGAAVESAPAYPYDLPTAGADDLQEVELLEARSGYII